MQGQVQLISKGVSVFFFFVFKGVSGSNWVPAVKLSGTWRVLNSRGSERPKFWQYHFPEKKASRYGQLLFGGKVRWREDGAKSKEEREAV